MKYFKAFLAGFLGTLIFHQGLLLLLNAAGLVPIAPFSLKPTAPLGVPSVLSLAFFGGLWGILLWKYISKDQGRKFWLKSFLFGAIAPTLVAALVVFPLKGIELSLSKALVGIILNGAWGLGSGWLIQKLHIKPVEKGFSLPHSTPL